MLLLFYKEPEETKPQVLNKPDIVIRKPSDGFDVGETEAQPMIHEKSSSRRNSKDFGTSQPGVTISHRVTASMRSMEEHVLFIEIPCSIVRNFIWNILKESIYKFNKFSI